MIEYAPYTVKLSLNETQSPIVFCVSSHGDHQKKLLESCACESPAAWASWAMNQLEQAYRHPKGKQKMLHRQVMRDADLILLLTLLNPDEAPNWFLDFCRSFIKKRRVQADHWPVGFLVLPEIYPLLTARQQVRVVSEHPTSERLRHLLDRLLQEGHLGLVVMLVKRLPFTVDHLTPAEQKQVHGFAVRYCRHQEWRTHPGLLRLLLSQTA